MSSRDYHSLSYMNWGRPTEFSPKTYYKHINQTLKTEEDFILEVVIPLSTKTTNKSNKKEYIEFNMADLVIDDVFKTEG